MRPIFTLKGDFKMSYELRELFEMNKKIQVNNGR